MKHCDEHWADQSRLQDLQGVEGNTQQAGRRRRRRRGSRGRGKARDGAETLSSCSGTRELLSTTILAPVTRALELMPDVPPDVLADIYSGGCSRAGCILAIKQQLLAVKADQCLYRRA